jgi:hypothetical protein
MPRKQKVHGLDQHPLRFSVPDAWTELPVLDNWTAYEHDTALVTWARRQARAMLGADATADQVVDRAATLAALTYAARTQGVHYSLAFFTANPYEVAGTLNVGQPSNDLPGKLEDVQVEETEARLPSGPALRVVRRETRRDDETGRVWHPETVVWTVWPPDVGVAVVLVFLWSFSYSPEFRDQLAQTAQNVASSVAVEPARRG